MQNPRNVAITAVEQDTIRLFRAAFQMSGSASTFAYHSVENSPRGIVGKRCELKEKIMLKMIGAKTKAKIRTT